MKDGRRIPAHPTEFMKRFFTFVCATLAWGLSMPAHSESFWLYRRVVWIRSLLLKAFM
jgi:hypothetical protein